MNENLNQCAQHFNVRVQRAREEPNIAIHEPIESEYLLYSLSAQKTSVFMTGNGGEMKSKALARLEQGQLARTVRERRHEKYTVWRISSMMDLRTFSEPQSCTLREPDISNHFTFPIQLILVHSCGFDPKGSSTEASRITGGACGQEQKTCEPHPGSM